MTVPSSTSRVSYAGDGSTQVFPVPFYFLDETDLEVTLRTAAGVEERQSLTTDYTVSGTGDQEGGSITMLSPPASGTVLVIRRVVAIVQETDYVDNDDLPAETLERDFDRGVMIDQQLQEELSRTVKVPVTSSVIPTLPQPAANKLIGWKSDETGLENKDSLPGTVVVSDYWSGVLAESDGVTATGTTVPRTLADRFAEWANVLDFGADPTGSDDSTPAFQAALDTGKPVWIPAGEYYFASPVKPAEGSKPHIVGAGRDEVTIRAALNVVAFFCDATVGASNRVAGFYIDGVTFDGEWVRTSHPYGSDNANMKMRQALNIRGQRGVKADVVIRNCRFKNIQNLPLWVAQIEGSVLIDGNIFERTKDIGILFCNSVRFVNNTIRFSSDNGLSVSRGNRDVVVANNTIFGCQLSGIFMAGVDLTGDTGISMTVSGASYGTGSVLTMSASSSAFTTETIGFTFTLRAGAALTVVRVTDVTDSQTATVVAMMPVPAPLQNTGTNDWSYGPFSGTQDFSVHGNVLMFCGNSGIIGSLGPKEGQIYGNTIYAPGVEVDSEVATTGTVIKSNAALSVASTDGFSVGSWVALIPDLTNENNFIAQITAISGTTVTLSANAPETYIDCEVRLAHRTTGSFGITAVGWFESTNQDMWEYAEDLQIYGNTIIDVVTGGIRLGSSSGSCRNSQIYGNHIRQKTSGILQNGATGILATEYSTDMRCSNLDIHDNFIELFTGLGTQGIRYNPTDTSAGSYITIGANKIRSCDVEVLVQETGGNTDITKAYLPVVKRSNGDLSLSNAETLAGSTEFPAGFSSGTLTVGKTMNVLNPSSNVTVTTVDYSALPGSVPIIFLRNASTNTITLTHDVNRIRCPGGTNLVIGAREMVIMTGFAPGIVQVLKV